MQKLIFSLLVAIILAVFACSKPASDEEAKSTNTDGAYNLSFTVADLQGNPLQARELQGKVAIVDFWATWCKPCIKEIPDYNELYSEFKDRGAILIGITLDSGTAEQIKPYVSKYNIEYPVYIGDEDVKSVFGGIQFYPTTFVLDQNGDIQERFVGAQPGKTGKIKKIIQGLLSQS